MKNVLLFSLVGLFYLSASSQNHINSFIENALMNEEIKPLTKETFRNNKAVGDTLWSEDFAGGLPACWTIVNNNANNIKWQWDTLYRAGQFSSTVNRINSTTAANGFMLLPLDSFNTPMPSGGAVTGDTYFQSCAIPINPRPNVELRLQQYHRYCCLNNSKVVVQVSTDNFLTFDEYNLRNFSMSVSSNNPELMRVNLSQTLAGADTAYLRFYLQGMSHYFWMIDDVALVEGNGMELLEGSLSQPTNYGISPIPTVQPLGYNKGLSFSGIIENLSNVALTGVKLEVSVHHTSSPSSPGMGLLYQKDKLESNNGVLQPFAKDTISIDTPVFIPLNYGEYNVNYRANSNQYPVIDSAFYTLTISDTVFARDYDSVHSRVGPSDYVNASGTPGGSVDGDRMGTMYTIDSINMNVKFSSVSFYIPNTPIVAGSVIRPVIWEFDESMPTVTAAIGREVASSNTTFTITSGQLGSWQSFKLDTGIAMTRANNIGQFVVGWEMVSGTAQNKSFSVGRDNVSRTFNPLVSNFLSFGSSPGSWGWIDSSPMIRLNIQQLSTDLAEIESDFNFTIYPNPSTGIFTISNTEGIKRVEIYSIEGKLVKMKTKNFNQLDLSDQPAGIYFIRAEMQNGDLLTEKILKN